MHELKTRLPASLRQEGALLTVTLRSNRLPRDLSAEMGRLLAWARMREVRAMLLDLASVRRIPASQLMALVAGALAAGDVAVHLAGLSPRLRRKLTLLGVLDAIPVHESAEAAGLSPFLAGFRCAALPAILLPLRLPLWLRSLGASDAPGVAGRPLGCEALSALGAAGVREILCTASVAREGGQFGPARLWALERLPGRGVGSWFQGAYHLLAARAEAPEAVLLADGDVTDFTGLPALLDRHRTSGATVTAPCPPAGRAGAAGVAILTTEGLGALASLPPIDTVEQAVAALEAAGARVEAVAIEQTPRALATPVALRGACMRALGAEPHGLERPAPGRGFLVRPGALIARGVTVRGMTVVAAGARVEKNARFAGYCEIGSGAHVGPAAQLEDCIVLPGTRIPASARFRGRVLGPSGDCPIVADQPRAAQPASRSEPAGANAAAGPESPAAEAAFMEPTHARA